MNSTPPPLDTQALLAAHVIELDYEDLPQSAIDAAKVFISDTLAVGMAGTAVAQAKLLQNALRAEDTGSGVRVWGTEADFSAQTAIMLNAFNVHCQEYDCLHEAAVVHAMATLLPVLMAQAQTGAPVSGRALITATVAGIDVAATLGLAASSGMRFFRPATAGGFGAVAGLARLRGLTQAELIAAWGFELAQASGTMQGHLEGSPILPLQVAFNARAAWQSCALAQSELGSLRQPLDGPFGYLPLFEAEFAIEPLLASLGQVWRIEQLSHKPYPSGRAAHGGIEGLTQLMREHQLSAQDIVGVTVTGPPLIKRLVGRSAQANPTASYARLCMPFVLAKVMQYGQLSPAHYFGEHLSDPQTFELAQRVRVQVDDNPDPNTFSPQVVELELKGGQRLRTEIPELLASPNRRLDRQARLAKFELCLAQAQHRPIEAQHLFERLEHLDCENDVAALIRQSH